MSELRQKILAARDSREELVSIPEWGVEVLVRTMTARERAKWGQGDAGAAGANLAILCSYDPSTGTRDADGSWSVPPERIFHATDRDALLEKSSAPLDRICDVALRLNGLDAESRKAVQESLAQAPNGASTLTSSSPVSVVAP